MRIPYNSLDGVEWLAFADYAAERSLKIADFAARAGHSLVRLKVAGVDPRMLLITRPVAMKSGQFLIRSVPASLLPDLEQGKRWLLTPDDVTPNVIWWRRPLLYWLSPRQARKQYVATPYHLLSPADFYDPWRHARLSAKFFRYLQYRASGVPR